MRLLPFLLTLCTAALAASTAELIDSTEIFIQAVDSTTTTVHPLAEIKYNPSTLSAELISFNPPSLPDDPSSLARIGIYDSIAAAWKSSTSVTSVESFAKGYSPTFVLSLDAQGAVIGVSVKSGKIDAGQMRDFGPKVLVRKMGKGKVPELNRPVVLSPEGKVEEPEPEKTMLQKYWWVILAGVMLLMSTGGGGE